MAKQKKLKPVKANLQTYIKTLNLEDRREYNKKYDDYNVANGHPGGHKIRQAMEKMLKKTDKYKTFLKGGDRPRHDVVGYDEAGEPVFRNDERVGTDAIKYDSVDAGARGTYTGYGSNGDMYSDLPEGVTVDDAASRWAWDNRLNKERSSYDKYLISIGQPFASDQRDPGDNPFGATDVDDFKDYAYKEGDYSYGKTHEQSARRYMQGAVETQKDPSKYNPFHKSWMEFAKGWLKDNPKSASAGEQTSMDNTYEPGLFTTGNAFNTQASRDVGGGKSGIVGNSDAGDAVYDANHYTKKAVSRKIKSRGQKLTASRKEQKLDRATERLF